MGPSRGGGAVTGPVAFVLGGGGVRGAVQVGMLRALLEAGVVPDLVVGTSIGAINGAVVAADPVPEAADRLLELWTSPAAADVYGQGLSSQVRRLARIRTHLISPDPLRRMLEQTLGADTTFEDLAVPLRVVAASIERAAEHWFDHGQLVPAIMASASVPGLFPPTKIGGEHFVDGGMVNSIPIEAARDAGARTIYVLQVGRVEEPLSPPKGALDMARVSFEIARRHRYAWDLSHVPEDVVVHVLPSGGSMAGDDDLLAFRRTSEAPRRAERAYDAARAYLAEQGRV